jgi:hypothetical protein
VWKTVHKVNEIIPNPPDGYHQWPEVVGATTTLIKLENEMSCSGLRIVFHQRQKHWNNHAVINVEMWCRCRSNDC